MNFTKQYSGRNVLKRVVKKFGKMKSITMTPYVNGKTYVHINNASQHGTGKGKQVSMTYEEFEEMTALAEELKMYYDEMKVNIYFKKMCWDILSVYVLNSAMLLKTILNVKVPS